MLLPSDFDCELHDWILVTHSTQVMSWPGGEVSGVIGPGGALGGVLQAARQPRQAQRHPAQHRNEGGADGGPGDQLRHAGDASQPACADSLRFLSTKPTPNTSNAPAMPAA